MRVIKLNSINEVVETKHVADGYILGAGELELELGIVSQIMQPDGTFITPEVISLTPTPTIEERLTGIEDTQDLILLRLEGVIV